MRILFTSDTHGNELALKRFAEVLCAAPYDCGIIAGDILEGYLPIYARMELLGLSKGERFLELFGSESLVRALYVYEERVRSELLKAKKPIFVMCGNHDLTAWESRDNIYNIHWKRVNFRNYNLIGYCHTEFSRTLEQQRRDYQRLRRFIDNNTILVTHSPPYGFMDFDGAQHFGSGPLREMLCEVKPRLHLFGHVHQASGHKDNSINGSWLNNRVFWDITVEMRQIRRINTFSEGEPMIEWARRRIG